MIDVCLSFSASWCGPCKMIAPFFQELSAKYTSLTFIKVDVDELEEISTEAGISAMPSFYIYKNGQIVDKLVGASKEKLEELIKKYA
jgi:thioredoxin 1